MAELPGLDPHDMTIRFADGSLTIEGDKQEADEDERLDHFLSERRYGDFPRSFRVPDGVDADKIEASFKNGVLTVVLPKTSRGKGRELQRWPHRVQLRAQDRSLGVRIYIGQTRPS
jgi:HSP20 family protein